MTKGSAAEATGRWESLPPCEFQRPSLTKTYLMDFRWVVGPIMQAVPYHECLRSQPLRLISLLLL